MRNRLKRPEQRRRLVDRILPAVAMALFAGLVLWGTTEQSGLAFAMQVKGKKNKDAAKNKDVVQKKDYQSKPKVETAPLRPIPGAGTTVDVDGLSRIIDDEITLRLKQEKIPVSAKTDDAEFLRRVYLDLTGILPTVETVRAFLDSKDPQKREKLIDELLNDSNYGKQLAEIWVTQMVPSDSANRALLTDNLRKWLESGFNKNKPWNKMVEELITATGNIDENGATIFFVANNGVDKLTGTVSKLFMGVQLQCAQCHNHPFTDWKQDEYWGMAAFFARVVQNGNAKQVAKDGGTITISEGAVPKFGKKGNLPDGAKVVPAKFLGAGSPTIAKGSPARPVLARWMTSADNPYFAKAMVNRTWAHFFGRGFVNPIDDMHDGNPATHPELLVALTEQFKRNNFDVKYLVKAIVLSEAYQRTSRPTDGNETDTELFSRMYIKGLTPEQLFDSIVRVVGPPKGALDGIPKKGAGGKKGGGPRDQFINFFRVEEGADPLAFQDGIPQALRLMNSALLNKGGKALEQAVALKKPAEAIEYLYMATLSRRPTVAELESRKTYVGQQATIRAAYGDILWALLNSSEFRLNH